MLRKIIVMLALASGAAAPAAQAQTVQNVLAEAGLLGRWASNCGSPPGRGNVYTVYAAGPTGEVTVTYDHGPDYAPTINRLLTARQIASDRVSYHQENKANGARLDIVVSLTATHLRVWSSIRSDGQVLVRDGKFTSDGVESPLQARCN
jgi:hypothetical protein